MFYSLRKKLSTWWFDINCRGILYTPPIQPRKTCLTIVSMLCHRDIIMYLVAIKSLYSYLGEGEIVILNDGSLTEKDLQALNHHVSPKAIVPIGSIETGRCPRGGCWERLLMISDMVSESYVIQLDADTITLGPISEVVEHVRANRSFTLGEWEGQDFQTMAEACANVKSTTSNHIQMIAERSFERLEGVDKLKYVRGCAAFTGFGKGTFDRNVVEDFSSQMEEIVGARWREWGSEQLTSNYIIANSSISAVLPNPKYVGFNPRKDLSRSSFLHFFGTYRFEGGVYRGQARKVVSKCGGVHTGGR